MRPLALICAVLLCPVAAHAGRSASTDVFRLSVSGTATAVWHHTDCDASFASEGARTARFHSRAPVTVRFTQGRIGTVEARGLAGTVSLKGINMPNVACSQEALAGFEVCSPTTRRFSNARVRLRSAGAGRILVDAPRVALRRVECPREPAGVVSLPLGEHVGPVHVSTHTLADRRTVRITVTTSATQRKTYGVNEMGTLTLHETWKLTFVRTGR